MLTLGQIVATPGALRAFQDAHEDPQTFLRRHQNHDWGVVDSYDWKANDRAAVGDERVLSAYQLTGGERIWIITERDRSVTTILLPSEY